jgi:hypothetical protein
MDTGCRSRRRSPRPLRAGKSSYLIEFKLVRPQLQSDVVAAKNQLAKQICAQRVDRTGARVLPFQVCRIAGFFASNAGTN